MELLEIDQGSVRRFGRTLTTDGRTPIVGVFTGSESFDLRVWPGDDQAPLPMPGSGGSWDDPAEATWTLTIAAADSAALVPATYRLRVDLLGLPDGQPRTVLVARLRVRPAPGTAPDLQTYCSFDEMKRIGGAVLDDLLESSHDRTGFAELRHEALLWTHRAILGRARMRLYDRRIGHRGWEVVALTEATGDAALPETVDSRLERVREHLANGGLVLTGDDDRTIVRANALYATALAFGRQLGPDNVDVQYRNLARGWMDQAQRMLNAVTFRIDADDDGESDYLLTPL